MAPQTAIDTQDITDKARRGILQQLEGVSKAVLYHSNSVALDTDHQQIRGRKNLVVQRDLLGPIGLFLKFSTLQEYGVDKLFVVENRNVEPSQRNIVFLARGEKPSQVQAIAGESRVKSFKAVAPLSLSFLTSSSTPCAFTHSPSYLGS